VLNIAVTDGQMEQLREIAFNHSHPAVRRKGVALLLKSQNVRTDRISVVVGRSENTVRNYVKAYNKGGIQELSGLRFHRPQSDLKAFDEEVKAYLDQTPPTTISQACVEIGALTGICRKETQVRKYLKSLGATRKKVCGIPAKADIQAQEDFRCNELEPRLKQAQNGKRDVYFIDASHFVMGAFLSFLWCLTRVFVRTPSGRKRFNVLGALNAVTHKLTSVTNCSYITSTEVCELLRKLTTDATRPITVVLDNARYQKCKLVMQLAKELDIELLFLPPYSPNLNLIERLWKLVKKECLNSRYHKDFHQFQNTIVNFLDHMSESHSDQLSSLLTLKFQTFTKEQFLKAI